MPGHMSKGDSSRIQTSQAKSGGDMSSSGFAARAQGAADRSANSGGGGTSGNSNSSGGRGAGNGGGNGQNGGGQAGGDKK